MKMKTRSRYIPTVMAMAVMIGMPQDISRPNENVPLSAIDKRLRGAAKRADVIRVSGFTTLWKKTTGLDWRLGFILKDKKLTNLLLQNFRCTNRKRHLDETFDEGFIAVDFRVREPDGGYSYVGQFQYHRRGKQAYWQESGSDDGPYQIGIAVRPGYGLRFEAFVRDLAKRARSHDRAVSYFHVHDGD